MSGLHLECIPIDSRFALFITSLKRFCVPRLSGPADCPPAMAHQGFHPRWLVRGLSRLTPNFEHILEVLKAGCSLRISIETRVLVHLRKEQQHVADFMIR